jgi:hypothetical protein
MRMPTDFTPFLALVTEGCVRSAELVHGDVVVEPKDPPRARKRSVDVQDVPSLAGLVRSQDIEGVGKQAAWALDHVEYLTEGQLEDLAEVQLVLGDPDAARATLDRLPCRGRPHRVRVFGDEGARWIHVQRVELLNAIDDAFLDVRFPGPDHRSLRQAEAWDSYERCDQSQDHKGSWQTMPRSELLACQWALAHLDAHGLQYILPAVMALWVQDDGDGGWLFDSVEFTLQSKKPQDELRAYQEQRFALMSPAQFAALALFAEHIGMEPQHVACWKGLAAGDGWPG